MNYSESNKTVRVIIAWGKRGPERRCKGCLRTIMKGEICVRYKKPHKNTYHCYGCAKKYNPAVIEEYEQQQSQDVSFES